MIALAATVLVAFVVVVPAYLLGRAHGAERRRNARGGNVRPRASAREVIAEARQVGRPPRFGDTTAGDVPARRDPREGAVW